MITVLVHKFQHIQLNAARVKRVILFGFPLSMSDNGGFVQFRLNKNLDFKYNKLSSLRYKKDCLQWVFQTFASHCIDYRLQALESIRPCAQKVVVGAFYAWCSWI
jgi:hypothetical protein